MRCFDLFAGCGGMSLGFLNAGYNIVGAIENWSPAVELYQLNFTHPIYPIDLRNEAEAINCIKDYKPEIIIGGPPCQDFSSAGKRDISNGMADLTYHFANIICQQMPNFFVMENVDQIKKSHILMDIISALKNKGYGISVFILNSAYCGVPQERLRLFMIGRLNGYHNEFNHIIQNNMSKTKLTIKEYLGNKLNLEYYYRHPRNYNRRGIFSIYEPSPTIRGVNRPIPKGYKLNPSDPFVNLNEVRPLTTTERAYIQTFPETYKFIGTKTNLEQIIGNAVPVKMAEFIAKSILNFITNSEPEFKTDLFENNIIIPQTYLKPI